MMMFDKNKDEESLLDIFLTDPNLRNIWLDDADSEAFVSLLDDREKKILNGAKDIKKFVYGATEDSFDESNSLVKLSISYDGMSAWIEVTSLLEESDPSMIEELIYEKLNNKSVRYGIRKQQIKRFSSNPIFEKPILVAQGKKPLEGKEGAIKFLFDMNVTLTPIKDSDYSVDPYDPDFVNYVKSGTLLCTSSQTSNDFTGYNLRGRIVKPIEGGIDNVTEGDNIQKSKDGRRWYATDNGEILLENGILSIVPVLRLEGVDGNTGDIDFQGSVYINGNVEFGKTVKAKNNIVIGGVLQDANVTAGGNLAVGKGIKGSKSTCVKVAGSVRTPFSEYGNLYVEGNVYADVILGGEVICEGGVYALGKKGMIVGGCVVAKEIVAKEIGNEAGAKTTVEIVSFKTLENAILEKHVELDSWVDRKSKMEVLIKVVNEARKQVLRRAYEQIEPQISELENSLEILQCKMDKIRSKYAFDIKVKGNLHSNVTLVFDNKPIMNDQSMMHCRLYYRYGEIKFDFRDR